MFEVGKTYCGNYSNILYECVWVGNNHATLTYDHDRSAFTYRHIDKKNYTEVKPKVKVDCWMNVYPWGNGPAYNTKEAAIAAVGYAVVARIHVVQEVEEGTGL